MILKPYPPIKTAPPFRFQPVPPPPVVMFGRGGEVPNSAFRFGGMPLKKKHRKRK
jgi:hypothetical protein